MHSLLVPSILLLLVAAAIAVPVAFAQVPPSKTRCDQLIKYFDYYGQSRGEGSTDGARNMTRIGARTDCDKGDYATGVAIIEKLLRDKKMGVPAPDWKR
ncbi:MAG: hypothetical protein EPO41_25955 [Reyranella sp.]|uniref:hypothetical protein n=1 Tax=Reyranella sp. TaxID=1929291 RepID=UPI0012272F87|nr:hypothetical protein [Reyranella sp.]TAJ85740.1 MAG: hypothetical protein EPO41_25955 [Reyranella sp.]